MAGVIYRSKRPYDNEAEFLIWVNSRPGEQTITKRKVSASLTFYYVERPGFTFTYKFKNGEPFYD